MSKLIDEKHESKFSDEIDKNGALILTIQPSTESKGSWSEIYKLKDDFFNVI